MNNYYSIIFKTCNFLVISCLLASIDIKLILIGVAGKLNLIFNY